MTSSLAVLPQHADRLFKLYSLVSHATRLKVGCSESTDRTMQSAAVRVMAWNVNVRTQTALFLSSYPHSGQRSLTTRDEHADPARPSRMLHAAAYNVARSRIAWIETTRGRNPAACLLLTRIRASF